MSKNIVLSLALTISYIAYSGDIHKKLVKADSGDSREWTAIREKTNKLLIDGMIQSIVERPDKMDLRALAFKKYGITPEMVKTFLQACKGDTGTMLYACENEDFLNRFLHAQRLGSPSSYMVRIPETTIDVSALALIATSSATSANIPIQTAITLAQDFKKPYHQNATEHTKLLPSKSSKAKKCRCRCTIV